MELDNFISKRDRDHKGQLYVQDILVNTDSDHMRNLFSKYGKVEAITVSKYSNPRGGMVTLRGTVTFEDK